MRKKSHIALTKGVVHGLSAEQRFRHRFCLYVGSILPDCVPTFLTRRHCIEETFDLCEKKMQRFLLRYKTRKKGVGICSSVRMGIVLHYIADYFTYPHNSHYPGNLKDHCAYEEILKRRMRAFIKHRNENSEQQYDARMLPRIDSVPQLLAYVQDKHKNYMQDHGDVNLDCAYSYMVCLAVMNSLLFMAANPA